MLCPRCSLRLPRESLVCVRCGEETPRPGRHPLSTRPPHEGPRFAPMLAREIGLERRGGGTRALGDLPPLQIRPQGPRYLKAGEALRPRAERPVLVSAIHRANTEPEWLEAPGSGTPDARDFDVDVADELFAKAPMARRLAAGLLDLAVITALAVAASAGSLATLGADAMADFGARGGDAVIDGLVIGRGLGLVTLGFGLVLWFVYATVCHALGGRTLGKSLLGLQVLDRDDLPPTLRDSLLRTALAFVTTLPAGLSLAWGAMDPRGITLHDRLTGTRVVFVPAPVVEASLDSQPPPVSGDAAVA